MIDDFYSLNFMFDNICVHKFKQTETDNEQMKSNEHREMLINNDDLLVSQKKKENNTLESTASTLPTIASGKSSSG